MEQLPVVKLVNFTPYAIETMYWAYLSMKELVPNSLQEFIANGGSAPEGFVKMIVKEKLGTPLEFVHTVWRFENVSRAFQQQLTRHRLLSFCIESMRVVDKKDFACERFYHCPEKVMEDEEKRKLYHKVMINIEDNYELLLRKGFTVEEARGVLPLNIYSNISMAGNLRAVIAMISSRLCNKVQGEFKIVAKMMKDEIGKKISTELAKCIKPPCLMEGRCQMRMENLMQIEGLDYRKPCERFVKLRYLSY